MFGGIHQYFERNDQNDANQSAAFYREELQNCLNSIAEELGINLSPDHRIRLFIPTRTESSLVRFKLIAFYADNSDLAKDRGEDYPDEGVLAEAYRRTYCHVNDLPDYNTNPDMWIAEQVSEGYMDNNESPNIILMKARSYAAIAIRSPKDNVKIAYV